MADIREWRPAKDAHAILVASVSVAFKEPANDKPWRRIEEAVMKAAATLGIRDRQAIQVMEFQIGGMGPPPVPPISKPLSGAFELIRRVDDDISEKVQVNRNGITFENFQYTRWAPMKERASSLMSTAFGIFIESVELLNVTATYTDGFRAITPGVDVDCSQVLDPESVMITKAAFNAVRPWHTHSGWFEYNSGENWHRRLHQVNIDVGDAAFPEGTTRIVQITTTVSDQYNQSGLVAPPAESQSWKSVLESLQTSHVRLKGMLGSVLNHEAQMAISMKAK